MKASIWEIISFFAIQYALGRRGSFPSGLLVKWMKIAIYAGTYKRNYDGTTKTLYELTGSMLLRKIKVGIWAFCLTPQTRSGLSLYKVPSIPLFLYPDYKIAFPFPKLKKQLDAFQPDVIHIAAPDLAGIFMVKYAKKIRFLSSFPFYGT